MEPFCVSVINSLFIKRGCHEGVCASSSREGRVAVVGLNYETAGQLSAEPGKGVRAVLLAQSLQTSLSSKKKTTTVYEKRL